MRVETPEIRWHHGPTGLNEAVLTIDFLWRQVSKSDGRVLPTVFATGGADKEIKLWTWTENAPNYIHSLSGHERSVNCVRFSPDGNFLASASDDSTIVIWMRPKHLGEGETWDWSGIANNSDVSRVLLSCGHKGDITDLAWSPDSAYLCSVSIDNTSVIWHVPTEKVVEKRKDHSQYVQGAAWDPLNEFLVTEGNDRSCRVYSLVGFTKNGKKKKCQLLHSNRTRDIPGEKTEDDKQPKHSLFHDDTFPAFSRRPTWTPDGNYCLFPTGVAARLSTSTTANTVYVYARGNLSLPAFHLPGAGKPSMGVRCSPVLYTLAKETSVNVFALPYRILFAVATLNAVLVYDSHLPHPVCVIDRIHYADLTDLSWSVDGRVLVVSSLDGYVTFITFDEGEIGQPLPAEELPKYLDRQRATIEQNQSQPKKKVEVPKKDTPKKPEPPKLNSIRQFTAVIEPEAAFDPANRPMILPTSEPPATAATAISATTTAAPKADVVHAVPVRKKRKITPILMSSAPAPAPETVDLTNEE
ncbi:unnamed protein product [Aphanomyces euteiches]